MDDPLFAHDFLAQKSCPLKKLYFWASEASVESYLGKKFALSYPSILPITFCPKFGNNLG